MAKNRNAKDYKILLKSHAKFGAIVAEEDDKLNDYYVGRDKYLERALDNNYPLIFLMGPKGVGKSAVLQMVSLERESESKRIVKISPDDLIFSSIANIEENSPIISDASKQQWLFKSLWDYIILMELWGRENPTSGFSLFERIFPSKNKGAVQRLYNLSFTPDGKLKKCTLIEKILNLIDEIEIKTETEIGSLAGKAKLRNESKDQFSILSEISNATKQLPETLKHNYYILIDDLDRYWKNEPSQNALIAALFTSIKKLSRSKVKFIVSIREDIYKSLPLQDKDKFRQNIANITWSLSDIKEMVEKRVNSYVSVSKTENIWGDIFPEKTLDKISKHTTLRPREVFRLLALSLEKAFNAGNKRVLEKNFDDALIQYSTERIEDIAGEYSYRYPDLNYIVSKFYGRQKQFCFKTIEEVVLQLAEESENKNRHFQSIGWNWVANLIDCPIKLAEILVEVGYLHVKPHRTSEPDKYDRARWGILQRRQCMLLRLCLLPG